MTSADNRKTTSIHPLVAIVLGVWLSIAVGWYVSDRIHFQHEQTIAGEAGHYYSQVASQLSQIEHEITIIAAFISKGGVPSPDQFHSFYTLTRELSDINLARAIGFAPIITRDGLPLLKDRQERLRDDYTQSGYTSFTNFPSHEGDISAPIILLEPPQSRNGAYGFDLLNDQAAYAKMEEAFQQQSIYARGPASLQEDRAQAHDRLSVVLYAPVTFDVSVNSEWERGIVAAPITPGAALQSIASQYGLQDGKMTMVLEGAEDIPIQVKTSPQDTFKTQYFKSTHYSKPVSLLLGDKKVTLSLSSEVGVVAADIAAIAGSVGLILCLTALSAAYLQRLRVEQNLIKTELLRQEVQLRESERSIAHSQKQEALGKLVGGVAHDFNNILAVILSNAEVILTYPVSKEVQSITNEIIKSSLKGASLTRHLLSFGRRAHLSPKSESTREILMEQQSVFRRVLPANIAVELSVENKIPNIHVDRNQLESALLNLALNSREAMPTGGIIHLSAKSSTIADDEANETGDGPPAGEFVLIEFEDTGHGMSNETLSKVFDPFFTTKDVGQGTGLGLSMVKGFARQSGGAAQISSAQGTGTTVHLYLPVAAAQSELA